MNIEIANRLVNLRKSNNLSQEALAEKLGISRQAVSKWERAEASPDTDNLILLARLYGVSLDELLRTEDEIPMPEAEEYEETESWGAGGFGADNSEKNKSAENAWKNEDDEYVHVGIHGVHVKDKDSEVHVGWDGIHVNDKKKGDEVLVSKEGIYVNGERKDKDWLDHHAHFPISLIIVLIYLVIGCVWNAWHPGWLLFFFIPIWHSLVEAIEKRKPNKFAYPVLAVLIYLALGFYQMLWHPGWVIFLTIPIYYSMCDYFKARMERRRRNQASKKEEGEADEAE